MARVKQYKWQLLKGSKKEICPNCGKKRFVPFVLTADNKTRAGREFGRCDRQNECGYFRYPMSEKGEATSKVVEKVKIQTSYIERKVMEATLKYFELQTLFNYFTTLFGEENKDKVIEVWKQYQVGTVKNGASIFWQMDNSGLIRTGKMMQYLTNGRRNKADFGTWVHRIVTGGDDNFNLKQCFFGLHLINKPEHKSKPIGIVESEKTALFMALKQPDILWLASGGSHNVQSYRFRSLAKRKITLYPDKGCANLWIEKTGGKYNIDFTLEDSDLPDGVDIMDYYLLTK